MKKYSFSFIITFVFVALALTCSVSAATINVPGDFALIEDAIDNANNGDTIQVAAGTYNESDLYINGFTSLTITGADQTTTIVDANNNNRVMDITGGTINISDLTLTNGRMAADSTGAGIAINGGATVTITNCTISNNTNINQAAGGIDVTSGATCILNGCTVENNSANESGGGISVDAGGTLTITDSTISDNTVSLHEGGGIRIDGGGVTATITNSTISNNTSASNGGGISVGDGATATITGCTISDNTTGGPGGGGITIGTGCETTLTGCTISSNIATGGSGAGIIISNTTPAPVTITNCRITNNEMNGSGSAISSQCNNLTITNCTIANNTETFGGTILIQSGSPTIKNCIIANATTYGIVDVGSSPVSTMQYNDFYGNSTAPYATSPDGSSFTPYTVTEINAITSPACTGNIGSNPLFVTAGSNYHLQTGSPCINAATSSGAPTTDLDGNTRPQDGGYDIGCYEHISTLATTWYLAENCTANSFYEFVTILNTNSTDATIDMTFYKQDSSTIQVTDLSAPATKRATFAINSLADGLDNLTEFGLKVESTNSVGITVERLLYKTSTIPVDTVGGDAFCATNLLSPHNSSKRIVSDTLPVAPNDWILGTNSIAAADTATTWYLVEGATHSEYQVFLLLTNPNTTAANVTFTFIPDDPAADDIEKTAIVPATSRSTYNVNTSVSELSSYNGFATKVVSDQAIVVERAMYSNTDLNEAVWGHCSVGSTTTAVIWYLSEGSSNTNYATDILLLNPGATNAEVTLTFIPEGGTTTDNVTKTVTITANSRLTYNINSNVSELSSYDGFATKVVSDQAIVAERVMYGPDTTKTWGHASIGSQTIGTTWNLPEGSIQTGVYDYIVLMNPGSVAATVTLTHMPTNATAENVIKTTTVAANSRTTYSVNSGAAELSSYNGFGTKISSDQPIVVGQSIYGGDAVNDWTWGQSSIGIVE